MGNTSATGGFVRPAASPAPLEDTDLEDFLQAMVVGITGLPDDLVRPRWQEEPPDQPDIDTDWAAIGVTETDPDTFAATVHYPGYDELRRHEILNILVSFYGPHSNSYAELLRDGLQIAQNREVLTNNGMGLVETGDVTRVPSLVKQRWQQRADLPMRIRRQVKRQYPILDLVAAEVDLSNLKDDGSVMVSTVEVPPP